MSLAPLLRRLVIAGTVLLPALPHAAAAQRPPEQPRRRVAVSVSGGISLGSYQAGVSWALVEFWKRYRTDGGTTAPGVPRFELAALAGASAGNINAVLAALEWCDAEARRPEASLFYRTWVRVGLEQLESSAPLAESNDEDRALFARRFFRDVVYRDIHERLARATGGACDMPIGITLTRLDADTFHLRDVVPVRVLRHAAVVRLARDTAPGDTTLRFAQARPAVRRARALGALLAPAVAAGRGDAVPADSVLAIVAASSAFPVAFAPRALTYVRAGQLADDGQCTPGGRCTPVTAQFADGGVFDNNPMGLVIGMARTLRPGPGIVAGDTAATTLVYVDPGLLRGHLATVRGRSGREREPTYGIAAVQRLLGSAVSAGRQYELFALERQLAGEGDVPRRDSVFFRPTSRGWPLIGEHLGAFAAFLGRPFREYDFYAGAYDGMHYLAGEYLCGPADSACARRQLRALISGAHHALSDTSRAVLAHLFVLDSSRATPGPRAYAAGPASDPDHVRVLTALASAASRLFSESHDECPDSHFVDTALCAGDFRLLIDSFATTQVQEVVERWKRSCRGELAARGDCLATRGFARLLEEPALQLDRIVDQQLRQLRAVELAEIRRRERLLREDEHCREQGRRPEHCRAPSHAARRTAKVSHFAYRSINERYRRGLQLDPSTIPDYESLDAQSVRRIRRTVGNWWWMSLLPQHLAGGVGRSAFFMGWRPSYYWRGVALVVPTELQAYRATTDRHAWSATVGAGAYLPLGSIFLSGAELSVFTTNALERSVQVRPADGGRALGGEAALYVVGGKLRLGARTIPSAMRTRLASKSIVATVGVADANGTLYWLLRR